ncbi:MAG: DUF6338 family protein [Rhodospirillales bacterium]|nr:DUF6338 family protein [Rhodospirillales bacterium]
MDKIDIAVFQSALIFFPGIIWALMHRAFCEKERGSEFYFILNCFVFGVATYVITFSLYDAFGHLHPVARFFADGQTPASVFSFTDLLVTSGVAIVLGLLWTYGATYKPQYWFMQKIKASKKYGNEDVWDLTFNSPSVKYVNVRDFNKQLVYAGWVKAFSESGKLREILISKAQIYNFDGELLYEMPLVYIARGSDDIHIEFPEIGSQTNRGQ